MRIGLVINILNEEYQISVFKGIRKRTEELGIELLCLQDENLSFEQTLLGGGTFSAKEYFKLDGAIILTSVMSDNYNDKDKLNFSKFWGDIPIVSVGQKIDNVPSLLVQTDDTMKALVDHLVMEHNYRRVIYLSGPESRYDAKKRESIFLDAMTSYQKILPDIKYIIHEGHFDEREAIDDIKECYRQNPDFNPDVIVCANDGMALGVYKFFKINKGNPEIKECAVTGFDDIPKGRYVTPSLTTIHQPLETIGDEAVNLLMQLMNGKSLPEENFVESKLILRHSCGCKAFKNPPDFAEKIQIDYVNVEEFLMLVTIAGQELSYCETLETLQTIFTKSTEEFGLQNFCVLKFKDQAKRKLSNGIGNIGVDPVFVKRNGIFYSDFKLSDNCSLTDFYDAYLNMDAHKPNTLVFKFLNFGNDIIGCVLYDATEQVLPYLVTISIDIAQALARIDSIEERRKHSEYLEKEVSKRTQQLIESNNKRMQVEAEVLQISELERQRFSTDLHDDICQRLAGISMLCRSYSKQEAGAGKAQMEELAELISDTLQTTRQYAHNSYPVELESLGMNHSISNLCNSFEKQSGIKCNYDWDILDFNFDKRQKLNIFRIIQEALHNAMKHSKAENVTVSVKQIGKNVIVQIIDDGCGFDKDKLDSNGIGINSMQYRANQIGATFKIRKNKPRGTCIEIKVDYEEK